MDFAEARIGLLNALKQLNLTDRHNRSLIYPYDTQVVYTVVTTGAVIALLIYSSFEASLQLSSIVLICFLVFAALFAAIILRICLLSKHNELQVSLTSILKDFERTITQEAHRSAGTDSAASSFVLGGFSHVGMVYVYRNVTWCKIPIDLLVTGDIVALNSGDIAPCLLSELNEESVDSVAYKRSGESRWIKGSQIAAGNFITWDHTTSGKSKRGGVSPGSGKMATSVLSSDSPELLKLCGNMRCFVVEETPLPARLQQLIEEKEGHQQVSANVFSDSMLAFVFQSLRWYYLVVLLTMFILLILRGLLSTHTDNNIFSIVSPICSLLLLALPIMSGCLFLSQLVSLISNAILFSEINDLHQNKRIVDKNALPEPPNEHDSDDHLLRDSNNGRQRQPQSIAFHRLFSLKPFSTREDSRKNKHKTLHQEEEEVKHVEQVRIRLSFTTLWQVVKRTYLCAMNWSSAENVELILSQPTATHSLVETLGAVSMVCFIDDDLVCDSSAVCEEILLMSDNPTDPSADSLRETKSGVNERNTMQDSADVSSKEGPNLQQPQPTRNLEVSAKSIVLDLYTQKGGQQNEQQQQQNRFENPLWFNYLLALKPLGLAALLDDAHDERGGHPYRYDNIITGNNTPGSNSSNVNNLPALAKRKLVDNVIKRVRYTSLSDLATQIGFTQQDADLFTPICDINVVAPRLEAAYFESDRHEMSLEEGRRRGYLVPTLRAGICRDTNRNGGFQMTSVGDPQLVLSYCKEYWDGSSRSITPLAPADRQAILQVFERWRLEDFDVLALSYSPLPDASFMETFFRSIASNTKRVSKHHHHHNTPSSSPRYNSWSQYQRQQEQQHQQQMIRPSIYFVDPSGGNGVNTNRNSVRSIQAAANNKNASVSQKEQEEQHDQPVKHEEQAPSLSYKASNSHSQSELLVEASEELDLMSTIVGDFTPTSTALHVLNLPVNDDLQDENPDDYFGRAKTAPAKTTVMFEKVQSSPTIVAIQLESTLLTRPVSVNEGLNTIGSGNTRTRAKSDAVRLLRPRVDSDLGQDDEKFDDHHDEHEYEKSHVPRKAKEAEDYHPPLQAAMTMPNLPRHSNRRDKTGKRFDKNVDKSFDKYHDKLSKSEEYIHARRQIWAATRQQIFLGMVASSVSIREEIPSIKEQLDESGVRFIYFSARNMKRSKPIAEKIGIPFDWNCAISLRALDRGDENDPHRYISNYADWDVMARMPHGIEAIRQHLLTVDNVPLLVSLFSDAVPETVEDMLGIFREYGETVLAIGGGYRSYNRNIFQASNLACSVYCLPFTKIPSNREDIFTHMNDKSTLCRADYLLVLRLVGLGTINLLQRPVDYSSGTGSTTPSSPFLPMLPSQTAEEVEVSVLLRLVHLSRKLLLNKLQIFAFVITSIVTLTLIVILLQAIPLTVSVTIPPFMIGFYILIVIPLITLSMIFNDDYTTNVMKLTPRKRSFIMKPVDIRRFTVYLIMRAISVAVPVVLCGYFTSQSVFRSSLRFDADQDVTTDSTVVRKLWLVEDMVVNASFIGIIIQSCYFQWRGYSLSKERLHNTMYFFTILVVLCTYCILMFLRSSWRNCQHGRSHGFYEGMDCTTVGSQEYVGYASVPISAWICFAFTAILAIVVAEVVNNYDIKFYQRHMQFLRFEFDTRLGMHSPR